MAVKLTIPVGPGSIEVEESRDSVLLSVDPAYDPGGRIGVLAVGLDEMEDLIQALTWCRGRMFG